MKLVILGLSLSSSWGNGHATTYRAILGALGHHHEILFLEREAPWYSAHRDLEQPAFCRLEFYRDVAELRLFHEEIATADAVIVGSFVPDGNAMIRRIRSWTQGAFCFYDIDTPVTLAKLAAGDHAYLSAEAIPLFDIYFSFSGGPILQRLEDEFGARKAVALFCSVDETHYRPRSIALRWRLGYLGTYSEDRQPALDRLLLEPARRRPDLRFVVAGPQYPAALSWPPNVERIEHLPPAAHPGFYGAMAWTLNITRADMAAAGYSPSVRLFEAAACGTPIISDRWAGLSEIFEPGQEIVVAEDGFTVLEALDMTEAARRRIGRAGRARCLAAHTASRRAGELEAAIGSLSGGESMSGRIQGVFAS